MSDNIPSAVILALDFGTTSSGPGYKLTQHGDVTFPKLYPGAPPNAKSCKAPTALLYDKNNPSTPIACGYMALKLYYDQFTNKGNETESIKRNDINLCLFVNFKMGLVKPETPWYDTNRLMSKKVYDLVVDFLRLFWKVIIDEIGTNKNINLSLTVPAIWTESQKQLMRNAAIDAEIVPKNPTDEQFSICLEPEAAAIDCIQNLKGKDIIVNIGERFLCVDCGGGTIDVTCYELQANSRLKEILPGAGNAFGSTVLDKYFERQLEDIFGLDFIDEMRHECPAGYHELIKKNWEERKCALISLEETARITVPQTLVARFCERVKSMPNGNDFYDNTLKVIKIPKVRLHKIFDPVFIEIEKLVKKFTTHCKLDYIFLVGGFAASIPLQKMIADNFSFRINKRVAGIHVPVGPQAAICKGGVFLTEQKNLITSRIARYSYLMNTCEVFDPKIHTNPSYETFTKDGIEYVDQIALVFVQRGDVVKFEEVVEHVVYPLSAKQTTMTINLYSSPDEVEEHSLCTTGCSLIGTLKIGLSGEGRDRKVSVRFHFGRAELKVEAIELATGKKCETTCVYQNLSSIAQKIKMFQQKL